MYFCFFSSRRRHTRYWRDWSSDVCSSDLDGYGVPLPFVLALSLGVGGLLIARRHPAAPGEGAAVVPDRSVLLEAAVELEHLARAQQLAYEARQAETATGGTSSYYAEQRELRRAAEARAAGALPGATPAEVRRLALGQGPGNDWRANVRSALRLGGIAAAVPALYGIGQWLTESLPFYFEERFSVGIFYVAGGIATEIGQWVLIL